MIALVALTIPVLAAEIVNEQFKPESWFQSQYVIAQNIPHIEIKKQYDPCSCVSYAKWKLGVSQNVYWGNAKNIKSTLKEPKVGGLILTYEGNGHLGVIISYTSQSITFDDSNYFSCRESRRDLSRKSLLIRGFTEK